MLDEYPIDTDYIGVDEQRADVTAGSTETFDASHTYDRSNDGGTGTERDVKIDAQTVSERDDRGQTRTGFNPFEASEGVLSKSVTRSGKTRSYAEWLMLLQNGYRDTSRKTENMREEEKKFIETATSYLEMSTYQRERVKHIINGMNFRYLGPYPMEAAVLAAISIVANEDDRWVREEETFKRLVTDIDGSMRDIKNVRQLVKQNSSAF